MADVFISYSRVDGVFADKVVDELIKLNRSVWIDRRDIPLNADWWEEIRLGIEASDNFVLIMSSRSLGSPVCHMEIEYAHELKKRMILVSHHSFTYKAVKDEAVSRIVNDAYVNELLGDRNAIILVEKNWVEVIGKINWVNFPYDATKSEKQRLRQPETDEEQEAREAEEKTFYENFSKLRQALDTDIEYVRQHTRFGQRAKEWKENNSKSAFLLRGDELIEAEDWLVNWEKDVAKRTAHSQPPEASSPTALHRNYIERSRRFENEQTEWAEKRERRVRQFGRAIAVLVIIGGLAMVATVVATAQANTAFKQVGEANTQVATANTQIAVVGETLTPIPETLTPVQLTLAAGNAQIVAAREQVVVAGQTLTPVPSTLTALAEQLQEQRELVVQADQTLTAVAQQIRSGQDRIESLRLAALANTVLQGTRSRYEAALLGIRALKTAYTPESDAVLVQAIDHFRARIFTGHTGAVMSVAFSPNGHYIVTGSSDKTARLWETETGVEIRQFIGHADVVRSVSFSPDGRYILTSSNDKSVRLWETETGKEVAQFWDPTDVVGEAAFSPDGRYIVTGSGSYANYDAYSGSVRLWEIETKEEVAQFYSYSPGILSVTFSPDGRYILGGGIGYVELWDVETGEVVWGISGSDHYGVAISLDGRYVYGITRGYVELGDLENEAFNRTFRGPLGEVADVAISLDGRYVAATGLDVIAWVWEAETGEVARQLNGHTDVVMSVAFSPDGRYILTGSADGTARLWETDYRDFIAFACTQVPFDFGLGERELYRIPDDKPTCAELPATQTRDTATLQATNKAVVSATQPVMDKQLPPNEENEKD